MSDANFPEWQIELDASKLKFPLEYKFILYNKQEKKADCWEKNPNRYLADPELKTNETLVISDRYVYFDIPAWKGAGMAIPVFSLKSEKSFGVGDFGDLKRLVDWAVSTHQKVIHRTGRSNPSRCCTCPSDCRQRLQTSSEKSRIPDS